jgi:hypothetical protein
VAHADLARELAQRQGTGPLLWRLGLADLSSVREFADVWAARPLDLLINKAQFSYSCCQVASNSE